MPAVESALGRRHVICLTTFTMDSTFEPHLVELAVRRHLDRPGSVSGTESREVRERLSEVEPGLDGARMAVLQRWAFQRLGLDRPFRTVSEEFPDVALPVRVGMPGQHEGCLLPDSRAALLVRVALRRFDDLETLAVWLRHEWMHASDMLRGEFGYPQSIPPLDPPVRDRLKLLWSAHVDARLSRRGCRTLRSRAAWEEHVLHFWSSVDLQTRMAAFDGFWTQGPYTHAELLSWAQDPRELLARFAKVPVKGLPGGRCPLCRFATFHWTFPDEQGRPGLAEAVRSDFPAWTPDDGLCERCVELYEIRTGHW